MTFPLANFLNQTVTYQPFAGGDNRDDPTYGAAQMVPARIVEMDRERYAKDEDIDQSRSRVWLLFKPILRSLINGREVVQAVAMVGVDGSNPGWTCVLR